MKIWSKYLLKLKSEMISLSESLSPKVRSKYILRPKFSLTLVCVGTLAFSFRCRSVNWLSERLSQKVKSPNVQRDKGTTPVLTLPYLRGGQVVTPAQRSGRISSAQCATPM